MTRKLIIATTLCVALGALAIWQYQKEADDPLVAVKRELGTSPGNCDPYAREALIRLASRGVFAEYRLFDCSSPSKQVWHAAACLGERCVESEHDRVVLISEIKCPPLTLGRGVL